MLPSRFADYQSLWSLFERNCVFPEDLSSNLSLGIFSGFSAPYTSYLSIEFRIDSSSLRLPTWYLYRKNLLPTTVQVVQWLASRKICGTGFGLQGSSRACTSASEDLSSNLSLSIFLLASSICRHNLNLSTVITLKAV